MASLPLQHEFDYFLAHQDELVAEYGGKVIVIKDQRVIGTFESFFTAVEETSSEHELGTFLVQECQPGPSCYTATFHGYRASFPL